MYVCMYVFIVLMVTEKNLKNHLGDVVMGNITFLFFLFFKFYVRSIAQTADF